jgi:hypothetical protein
MRSLPAKHINLLAVNIGYSADELDCWAPSKTDLRQDFDGRRPGVPLDLSQCSVERGMRPLLYGGHSFRCVALRMVMNRRGALAVMRPIERPSRSVNCQTVPPFAGVTITSMVNLEPLRRANKPLQQPMAELPSSAAAAFSVLERIAASDRPAIERMAFNADMCDYVAWSKRKVEGQRREKKWCSRPLGRGRRSARAGVAFTL